MTNKHTPAPWHHEPGQDCKPPYVVRGSEGGFVVTGLTAERQEADAALIAAAPDIFKALDDLFTDMLIAQGNMRDAAKHDHRWEGCAEEIQPRIDAARAAIAKARGAQ
jgi:hypothetical protein